LPLTSCEFINLKKSLNQGDFGGIVPLIDKLLIGLLTSSGAGGEKAQHCHLTF
jgi:hypothetical protein